MGMAHELKYKMNEFILNFPETLGLQRLSRLEARVFYVSPRSLMLQGFQDFFFFFLTNVSFSSSAPGQSGKCNDWAKGL